MKRLLLALCVTASAMTAGAAVVKQKIQTAPLSAEMSQAGWIPMSSICYRGQDYNSAANSCDNDARLTGMISNDDVVISSSCRMAGSGCPYGYQYQLDSRALFVYAK